MKQSSNKMLKEHLSENDLKWLVDDNVLIDMHKTKLGEDRDYIVLSIAVKDKTPAHDLAKFLETSVHKFKDIEVSAATDSKGRYLVYVELERSPEAFASIDGMLADSSRLSGIENWKFKTMGLDNYVGFEQEAFNQYVITDPTLYEQRHPTENNDEQPDDDQQPNESVTESIKNRLKFLMKY